METVREIIARIVASNMFGDYRVKHRHPFDNEVADTIIAALGSAGYAIVPREATQPMLDAAIGSTRSPTSRKLLGEAYAEEWRAMLTAAGEEH